MFDILEIFAVAAIKSKKSPEKDPICHSSPEVY